MSLSKVLTASLLEQEDNDARMVALLSKRFKLKKRRNVLLRILANEAAMRRHKYWTHTLRTSAWWDIVRQMSDGEWQENFRLSKKTFAFLTDKLQMMDRTNSNFRKCIPLEKRVAIAVYALSSTAEYRSICHLFGVGKSSVCEIVKEFAFLMIEECMHTFIRLPLSKKDIKSAAVYFEEAWGFPQCIGALDGCHIKIQPPKETATAYFNYKSFYSVVLLALVDYRYRFLYVDVGSPGRNNDSFVFQNSTLKDFLEQHVAFTELKQNWNGTDVPIGIMADSAFPLLQNLWKPYPEHLDMPDILKIFNYILSKGRAVVENAFGRLKARFRMLRKLENDLSTSKNIILTACILNNICEIFGDYFDPRWLSEDTTPKGKGVKKVCTQGEKDKVAVATRDSIAAHLYH